MSAATPGQADEPMKLYLAGPMRGYPDRNFPAFADAAGKLRADGHMVYNPAENDAADLRANLAADMAWISLVADGVILLPGWTESRGATAENALRAALGLPGWELESFPGNTIPDAIAAQEPHAATVYRLACGCPIAAGKNPLGNWTCVMHGPTTMIGESAEQPAPEMAAYEADIASLTDQRNRVSETADQLREVITEILDAFSPSGSGHTARVGMVQIAKWRTRAGLTS